MKRTLVAALAFALASATCLAQTPNLRVRGPIVAFDGTVLTVGTPGTPTRVTLAADVRVNLQEKGDLSTIGPGDYIGSGAMPQPDGTLRALEFHIFPEALRGAGEGSRPWDRPGALMTNATVTTIADVTVDTVNGRYVDVSFKDGTKRIFVPRELTIARFSVGERSALVPGAAVSINAVKREDGSLFAASVSVGKNGFVPPN